MPLPEAEKAVLRLADQIALVTPDGFLSEELYEALLRAPSAGAFYNARIRDSFSYKR